MAVSPQPRNVVIVGASFAGHALANALAKLPSTHRIVLIDRNDFAVHLPAVVSALVVPGSEESKLTAPLKQETVFPSGSRHVFVHAAVEGVDVGARAIALDREYEGSRVVPFDKLVLATGATGTLPIRPGMSSLSQYKAALRASQEGIARAESVLVVGGGAVGVEVMGEITSHYPDKKATLVHSRSKLLVTAAGSSSSTSAAAAEERSDKRFHYEQIPERVSDALEAQLRARGVDLVLGDRLVVPDKTVANEHPSTALPVWDGTPGPLKGLHAISLQSGRVVAADYVFLSTSGRPNTSVLPRHVERTVEGYVVVDDHFRVPSLPGVYAMGDAANMPGRKSAGLANFEAAHLGKILLDTVVAEARGTSPANRAYAVPSYSSAVIPLGDGVVRAGHDDRIGAGALSLGWLGVWPAPQWMIRWMAKDYFADMHFFARFQGCEKVSSA